MHSVIDRQKLKSVDPWHIKITARQGYDVAKTESETKDEDEVMLR